MKVVSYLNLFGNNDFISCEEENVMIKDNTKYLSLELIESNGFYIKPSWVEEVEFECMY